MPIKNCRERSTACTIFTTALSRKALCRCPCSTACLTANRKAKHGPNDFHTCRHARPQVSRDFAGPHAPPIRNRNFHHPEAFAQSFDLHFDGPAVIPVTHFEPAERIGTNGPKGPQIRVTMTEKDPDQTRSQTVPKNLVGL